MNMLKGMLAIGVGTLVAACAKSGGSYSILATGQSFKQAVLNTKVDLLWVIDNSSSMTPLQQNLTANFNSFISNFVTKGYDFQLAVTTTEAYASTPAFRNTPALAKFRDGAGSNHTGVFTLIPTTPNLLNIFVTNASQGVGGSGDERAFSSFKAALDSPLNTGFVRGGSFLGIIILSDEDDFSNPTRAEGDFSSGDHNYAQPGLQTTDTYVNYLDALTLSSGAGRRYSVSAITVLDEACRAQHAAQASSTNIGTRYMELVGKTGGVTGSVCDASFATSLANIQAKIVELSTQFYLDAHPAAGTLVVTVNNAVVPEDAANGWTYNSDANSIIFHGAAVPTSSANIGVNFDPTSIF